ncbi:MAG: YjbQ family protein [SAR324 cluster bacterium]|nr:YjbQ family protein [SAR324 cluster bacterium]
MRQHQETIRIQTRGKALSDITREVQSIVDDSGIETGMCHTFLRHTSASLLIQENADPDVLLDLENFLSKLVPENDPDFFHNAEGPDDMPAHIRTALTHTSEQIPIARKRLFLGIWQGIYLWEHRHRSHVRELVVHIFGN